jgi:hypothetical protein
MAFARCARYFGYLAVGAGGLQLLQQTVSFTSSGDDERRFSLASRVPTRSQQLSRLRQFTQDAPCDVLIVGGGATGAGCALDATSRCAAARERARARGAAVPRGAAASAPRSVAPASDAAHPARAARPLQRRRPGRRPPCTSPCTAGA